MQARGKELADEQEQETGITNQTSAITHVEQKQKMRLAAEVLERFTDSESFQLAEYQHRYASKRLKSSYEEPEGYTKQHEALTRKEWDYEAIE